jgi:hypothetical protein
MKRGTRDRSLVKTLKKISRASFKVPPTRVTPPKKGGPYNRSRENALWQRERRQQVSRNGSRKE